MKLFFSRTSIGREGNVSLKIETDIQAGENINNGEISIFKQFDVMTNRFAVETLQIADSDGLNSEYWSLSTAEADRSGGKDYRYAYSYDVSNTGKGILIGSDSNSDTFVVTGVDDVAEVKVIGFDSSNSVNDMIDLSMVGDNLTTQYDGSTVNVSQNGVVKLTLLFDEVHTNIDDQLIGVQSI